MSAKFHSELWTGRLAIVAGIGLCAIAGSNGVGFPPRLLESLLHLSGERLTSFALLLLGMTMAVCGAGLIERRAWARWTLEAFCWAGLFSATVAGVWIVPAGIFQKSLWPGSGWYSLLFLLAELASLAWTLVLAIPLIALLKVLRSHALRNTVLGLY